MKKINQNKKVIRSHQSGIALVTTIILTSIMLASIVVVTKEMVDEARNAIRINNSLIAYYAAEAGLEDALLQFRYDHDAQISEDNDNNQAHDVSSISNDKPRTVDISSNPPVTVPNTTVKNNGNSYYELKMWNKVPCIASTGYTPSIDPSCTVVPILKADDTFEFSVKDIGSKNLVIKLSPRTEGGIPKKEDALENGYRIELTTIDENGNILPPPIAKQFTCPVDIPKTTVLNSVYIGPTGKKNIRIKPWYTRYTNFDCISSPPSGATGLQANGTIDGTDFPYINFSINNPPVSGLLVSGPTTTIESVGFYGGVQRRIVATVDYSSGNIIGIFDYVIYSASDLIK